MSRRNLRGGVIENAGSYNKAQENTGATKSTGSSFANNRARLSDTTFKKFSKEVPTPKARKIFSGALKAAYPVGVTAGEKYKENLAADRLYSPVYLDPDQDVEDAENRGDVEAEAKRAERNRLYTMNP